jgi:hypothetical protein
MANQHNRQFRKRAVKLATKRSIPVAAQQLGVSEAVLTGWVAEAQARAESRSEEEQSHSTVGKGTKRYSGLLRHIGSFSLGVFVGVLGSLGANRIDNWSEARQTIPEVACLLLEEIKVNESISQRKHVLITDVMLDWRLHHNREALSKLNELKYQHFSNDIYDNHKAGLRFFPATASKRVEGLHVILHQVDVNEPGLIDEISREIGKEDYNLNALIYPYAQLDGHLFSLATESLKPLCYKSP